MNNNNDQITLTQVNNNNQNQQQQPEPKQSHNSFLDELIGGTVAGVVGLSLVYPLDTMKTRLQINSNYNGMLHVYRDMVAKDGMKALYRGLASPACGFGVVFAISFSSYGWAVRQIREYRGIQQNQNNVELALSDLALAGGFTGFVQAPARCLLERIKVVMQTREGVSGKAPYKSCIGCFVDLAKTEGILRGPFRGMGATFIREIPQFAVYYPFYEFCKRSFAGWEGSTTNTLSTKYTLLSGAMTGLAIWVPPLYSSDVIKSRMQNAAPGVYSSSWDCLKKTVRREGVKSLFSGMLPTLYRGAPMHACVFFSYETTISFLQMYKQKQREVSHHHIEPMLRTRPFASESNNGNVTME